MKKLYLFFFSLTFAFTANAQTTMHFPLDYGHTAGYVSLGLGSTTFADIQHGIKLNDNFHTDTTSYLKYAAVLFDTLWTAIGTKGEVFYIPRDKVTQTLDSFLVKFDYVNISGTYDTIHLTVFNTSHSSVTDYGTEQAVYTTPSLWDTTMIVNKSFSDPVFALPPNFKLPKGESFGVRIEYSGATENAFYLLIGQEQNCPVTNRCGGASLARPGRICAMYTCYDSLLFRQPPKHNYKKAFFTNDAPPITVADCYKGGSITPGSCDYYYIQYIEAQAFLSLQVDYGVTISIVPDSSTFCPNTAGSVKLHAHPFGSTNPNYTYRWSVANGFLHPSSLWGTATVRLGNGPATIGVTVTDGNNVTTSSSITVPIDWANCSATFKVMLDYNRTICPGSNVILKPYVSSGSEPYKYSWSGTGLSCTDCENPSVIPNGPSSTYYVTVTDDAQRTATAGVNFAVSGSATARQVSLSNTNIDCSNTTDTTTLTVSGSPDFIVDWGDGSLPHVEGSSPVIHPYTNSGAYIIKVTDADQCNTTLWDTVENNGVKISLVEQTTARCLSGIGSKLKITASGGTPGYTFKWSNGATGDSIINMAAGKYYTVTATDAASCSSTARFFANATDRYYYTYLTHTNANCANNGAVFTTVYGGTPPFKYLWNTNDTSANLHNTAGGHFSVTITDSIGCTISGSADVDKRCDAVIRGIIFEDKNGNCQRDENEHRLQDVIVVAVSPKGNKYYGTSIGGGNYFISVPDTGIYTITSKDGSCSTAKLCSVNGNQVTVHHTGDTILHNDFAYSGSGGNAYNLGVHPGWTSANPGFQKEYWVFYYNSSANPFTGKATIVFSYDPNLVYKNSTPPAVNDAINHTLTWVVDSVPMTGINQRQQLRCFFTVPADFSMDAELHNAFSISPTENDCNPSDNLYTFSEKPKGSHDPNAKTVIPEGYAYEEDSVFTYTVHFQNNGTDSTWFIIVTDTLPSDLDPASVVNIASSHTYSSFEVSGNGILTWTFNPLRLVDSITDPVGSQGFVMFTIKRNGSRAIGSVISNSAAIVFDYNGAVITNHATDTISVHTDIVSVSSSSGKVDLMLFPNPANSKLHLVATGFAPQWLAFYDVNGRKVSEQKFVPNTDISQLVNGIYIVEVKGENGIVQKKLVKY